MLKTSHKNTGYQRNRNYSITYKNIKKDPHREKNMLSYIIKTLIPTCKIKYCTRYYLYSTQYNTGDNPYNISVCDKSESSIFRKLLEILKRFF